MLNNNHALNVFSMYEIRTISNMKIDLEILYEKIFSYHRLEMIYKQYYFYHSTNVFAKDLYNIDGRKR